MTKAFMVFVCLFSSLASADPVLDCYQNGLNQDVPSSVAAKLCRGAISNAPISCYVEAIAFPNEIASAIALPLCTGAQNNASVICYMKAVSFPTEASPADALELCQPQHC